MKKNSTVPQGFNISLIVSIEKELRNGLRYFYKWKYISNVIKRMYEHKRECIKEW